MYNIYIIDQNNNKMSNNSYFNRHKLVRKQTKTDKKIEDAAEQNEDQKKYELKIQQKLANTMKSKEAIQLFSYAFNQQKSEEQHIYEQYKQISAKYTLELQDLQKQIEEVKKEEQMQKKKVKQAEISLVGKKKELNLAKIRLEETQNKLNKQQENKCKENKIAELESKLKILNEENALKFKILEQQYQKTVVEHQQMKRKLQQTQDQYKKCIELDLGDYQTHKKRLQEEEEQLQLQLKELQNQSAKVKRDIDKIQKMKPVSNDIHKKYLELFQKMFISKEISKAEKILALKQEEKKQSQEFARRREWLKEKQIEIATRQKRIVQKNQIIDSLTQEIKEKSTLLLKKYHGEAGRMSMSGKK